MVNKLIPIVSISKSKWNKLKKIKKFASNSTLQAVQILPNDAQIIVLCISYLVTTVRTF